MKKPLFTEDEVQKEIDNAIEEAIRKTGHKPDDKEIAWANWAGHAFANWVNNNSGTFIQAFEKAILEVFNGKEQ